MFQFMDYANGGTTPMTTETALYRHFDTAGTLLYVGISLSPFQRTRQLDHDHPRSLSTIPQSVQRGGGGKNGSLRPRSYHPHTTSPRNGLGVGQIFSGKF
jgi:hypothetical protein